VSVALVSVTAFCAMQQITTNLVAKNNSHSLPVSVGQIQFSCALCSGCHRIQLKCQPGCFFSFGGLPGKESVSRFTQVIVELISLRL
jgi:hypothetical protein